MSDKPLNVAIAGLGVMGMVAGRAFNRSSRYRVIAIADQSPAALERALIEVPNAVQFSSADDLVTSKNLDRNEIDLVAVLTPPNSHAQLAIQALQAKRHVFCEKPLALNSLEAEQMVAEADIARASSVFSIVGHQLRYNGARRWIKDQISSGAIGKPQHIQIIANFPKLYSAEFSWWSSHDLGGGLLYEYGSHMIDLLEWWFGPAFQATGEIRNIVKSRVDNRGVVRSVDSDDLSSFRLLWASGLFADVLLSGVASNDRRDVIIHGDEATLVLDSTDTIRRFTRGNINPEILDMHEQESSLIDDPNDSYTQPHARLLEDFAIHISKKVQPIHATTFHDGERIIRHLDSIRASSTPGTRIEKRPK